MSEDMEAVELRDPTTRFWPCTPEMTTHPHSAAHTRSLRTSHRAQGAAASPATSHVNSEQVCPLHMKHVSFGDPRNILKAQC